MESNGGLIIKNDKNMDFINNKRIHKQFYGIVTGTKWDGIYFKAVLPHDSSVGLWLGEFTGLSTNLAT